MNDNDYPCNCNQARSLFLVVFLSSMSQAGNGSVASSLRTILRILKKQPSADALRKHVILKVNMSMVHVQGISRPKFQF
jgi:hypothetical protein